MTHSDAQPEPVLLEGMRFEGLLVLPRHARIDGHVRGEVLAGGTVWVGPSGVVEADLEADAVIVEGRVEGDVRALRSISLGPDAAVRGGLHAPVLEMEEGARVEGRCQCGPRPPQGRTQRPAGPRCPERRGAPPLASEPVVSRDLS